MKVKKSEGVNSSENLLTQLCESTFLKLWSYPNPFKDDGKEMCDVIAVFNNEVFLFFDRKSEILEGAEVDENYLVKWNRWRRKVVEKQLKTVYGAERYLRSKKKVFLDPQLQQELPIPLPGENLVVHKIIVAHGAAEACLNFSDQNISGSLAVSYGPPRSSDDLPPFFIGLDRGNPVHVFDSANLEILMSELDTVFDFSAYLTAKVGAIQKYKGLSYCAEEDLLAHYYLNFDDSTNQHFIGVEEKKVDFLHIAEGDWSEFVKREEYIRKKEKDRASYLWDRLIQKACGHALNGTLMGNRTGFFEKSAIHEMAKEPRFSRRFLSEKITVAICSFPSPTSDGIMRQLTYLPSFFPGTGYVFFQLFAPSKEGDENYREIRQNMLAIACGAAKNRFPELRTVIGIATEPPRLCQYSSEDFIYMDCSDWSEVKQKQFEEANEPLDFFKTGRLQEERFREF